jgi:hypothetical protein
MKKLKGAEEIQASNLRRLVVRIGGREKQGKSTWALTAPVPIAYHNLNNRVEHVLDRFVGRGIYEFKYDTLLAKEQHEWKYMWDKFRGDFAEALGNTDVRTIVIDTETDLWEMRRLAQWGRESSVPDQYGGLNKDIRNLYDAVISTDKNLIVISEMKKKYITKIVNTRGGKRELSEWDGSYEFAGWSNAGAKVEVNLEAVFNPEDKVFSTTIHNCGVNAMIAGQVFEGAESNFPFLASTVFPDTDPGYWGYDEYVSGL